MNLCVHYLVIMLFYSCCYLVDSGKVNVEFYSHYNPYGMHFTAISKSGLIRMCHHLTKKRVCTKYKRSAWYNTTVANYEYYELDILDNATKPNYDIKLHHKYLQATRVEINTIASDCELSKTYRGGSKYCGSTYGRYETQEGRNGYVTIDILYSKPFYCKVTK